ncbi:PREDICTED: probable E3 ubiquitin-protein ligase HECTD4 [Thamnophis sirtalis]|uniref:Probable E3 ubiquitin-protein ligase HECTD4 n=1 Tax=Thamnophis sirtalis TaxID=35019 RepID=A0A6I9X6Y9_9SAUR|nr:PREDICTED: probable E3 ubiquitin-protein ligase HECTD4 [Thamnophis sirtalis]
MGLLLVFPLIESQSRTDPSLGNVTAEVLLTCLRDCQPLSLTKEPADCLNGIEALLCSWLEETSPCGQQIPHRQKENAAAALVALACARGSLKTFVHTVHLLQKQTDLGSLPVADVLYRLLLLEGGPGSPSCLLGGKHMVSWGFEDMLPAPEASPGSGSENKDADLGRCLAVDGLYLYTTNSVGRGISKLGSGLHGTLRGFVYSRNEELESGWVAFGNGRLLHRPVSFDSKPHSLFQVIDQNTLQVCQLLPMPPDHFPIGSTMTTVHLSSDGTYFYWIWSPASLNEKTPKGHSVFMDVFELKMDNGLCIARPLQERIILMRKEGDSAKSINEMLLSRLSRYRASPSATLAALTGSTISNTLKEDQAAANTSCGLPLKMLRKTPIYTCGTYLVMLIPPPGGSGSSATRSLFGGSSGLSSLKILASSLVYNLSDGQFASRADLIDAAGSSLGRGALVPGLGACYDAMNNMIWTCSNDYIDQWCNPGNQAFHYICQRLGVSHVILEPQGDATATNEVINQLLHHVGAMCIHQLNLLAASNNMPVTNFLAKQHPIEAHHLSSICDIMEKAMVNGDTCIIRCILVVFQVVFKFFFSPQTEKNREIVRRSGLLLWQLLMAPVDQISPEIQKEVCLAISSGLSILYPGETEINNLLKLVLTEVFRTALLLKTQSPIFSDVNGSPAGASEARSKLFPDERSHMAPFICLLPSEELLRNAPAGLICPPCQPPVPVVFPLQLVIYAGPNTNSRKVAEYGGNTLGYGSRSVLGTGWPKDLVKVEGDTVTFSFEMRSGREHNTPDKAMWGFACTVRAQESSEDVSDAGACQRLGGGGEGHPDAGGPLFAALIGADPFAGGSTEAVHSGLARQVSSLLTNHLARATECCGNQAAGNDALQDVLSLLNDLSRSHIGKAILSQPACVSKLLSLLLDQRPSPKLVLIILQLCRAALPLMSVEDCGNVELPPWSYSVPSLNSEQDDPSDPASKIASLLLAKLADYVVPGCQTVLSPTASEPDTSLTKANPKSSLKGDKDPGEESEAVDGKLSIFIHKREDQSSHEVLQPLLSSSEGRPFRLGTGANMEKVVKMDRDMTKSGCCEVITEEAAAALRKATKWAQSGLIVSVGPPVETVSPESTSGLSTGDKKKTAQTSICRERNSELARTDPVRPFISGHVANSMAAEVIALLHSLLMAPESNAAQIWTTTAEKVLSRALMYIPQLGKYAESILENGSSNGRKLAKLQRIARQAVAALCALGGFKETIKIGSEVQVLGRGIARSVGVVASINEQEGIATVRFPPVNIDSRKTSQASDILTIPLSRLCIPRSEEVNSVIQKPSHPMAKTKILVKSLMNRAELLLHVTIAAQSGLTRSISGTPAETPACKSASETKVISHAVRQPVFLRSMSAPSDLEMIANEDLEFTRSSQRRRHVPSHRSSSFTLLQSLAIEDSRDKPTYSVLLGQLFAFIGTNPEQAYDSDSSCHYKTERSYENFIISGPDLHPPPIADDESDDDDDDDVPREDHYALLVKAWETKVFPTIRRRFRNEAERKSGLDQIKGALQLGERLLVVEAQCERLRMLYRDSARPPPPPLQADRRQLRVFLVQPKEITWSPSRVFPPVRACMFSSHLTAVTFLADPSAGGGLPRGTFIYATSAVPVQAPSFYWEIEIVSYGDADDDTGPIVSFGFATEAEKRDGAWTNPVGTCLFHKGKGCLGANGSCLPGGEGGPSRKDSDLCSLPSGLIFYDTKVTVLNRVLNATVQRTADHAAPEITLDPLEIVGGEIRSSENSYFCQAARQLACIPSSQLCVKLASGGDPTYAFNIRFTGEEVHGTSGSFRHFLWQVCKELQSTLLSLLLLCPSSSVNKNKGKYILTPSPISYGEEQLLHFFGQLLGIAIRADVPLPLDLLPSFWKILVGEPLEPDVDLQEADVLTYNYVKKFENLNDETELEALCAEIASQHLPMESPDSPNKPSCKFTYVTMTGEEVELCARGRHIPVVWENKDVYAAAIRNLRLHELQTAECVMAVRAGLATIIPLQILTLLTPLELELRTCGLPYINLEFLKAHTMYQVGLMETDQHIEFFWGALEMFTQEELCKFIKFACNQERIPFTCPCKDGGPDTAHVPPYPMKIAPPDGTSGSPDSRHIRVETCMFMIKLPQYSSLETMLEKLRYAIHYREDPLSG